MDNEKQLEIFRHFFYISPLAIILKINDKFNTSSKIAFETRLQHSSVINLIKKMEEMGLLTREKKISNKRIIKLTPKGTELQNFMRTLALKLIENENENPVK